MLDYLSVPYPIRRLRAYLWSRRPPRGQLEAASRWAARELRRAIRRMDAAGWREQPGLKGIRHDALRAYRVLAQPEGRSNEQLLGTLQRVERMGAYRGEGPALPVRNDCSYVLRIFLIRLRKVGYSVPERLDPLPPAPVGEEP